MKKIRFLRIWALFAMLMAFAMDGYCNQNDHYSKATVKSTGNGVVYVSDQNSAPSDNQYDQEKSATHKSSETGNSGSHTYYLFSKEDPDYYFEGWYTNEACTEGKSTSKTFTITATGGNESSATEGIRYAKFSPIPTHYSKATAIAKGNGTVYVSDTNTEGEYASTKEATKSVKVVENPNHTYYYYAKPAAGYYFDGWYTNEDCTDGKVEAQNMTQSVTASSTSEGTPSSIKYYAKFTQIPSDMTGWIVNPDFEASPWNQGWTGTGDNKEVSFAKNDNHTVYAEMWKGDAVGGKIYQTISNLPKGYYTLSASTAGDVLNSVYAKVGAHVYQQAKGEGDWNRTSVVFRIDEEQADVEIGYLRPDNVWWWSAVDDFQLEYMGTNPTYEYNIGIRLDGSYLSKPAYTSTPMDGVDPEHPNDALLVITWRGNSTTDPTDAVNPIYKLMSGSKAEIWADGSKVADAELSTEVRSTNYDNGFGLYIPDFDETKTYTVKVPANVFGYIQAGYGNEAFEIQAKQSPVKDGKYFITVKSTGEHVSRGGHFGTQAILDYYGVPVLVQTTGLTEFKFLDNQAFLGRSYENDELLYTDCKTDRVQHYQLIANDERPGEYQFYTAAPKTAGKHYLAHGAESGRNVMMEQAEGDYYTFEPLTEEGYAAHLAKIEEDEAIRVAARAGFGVNSKTEYDELIEMWESKGFDTIFPTNDEETATSQAYHEKREGDMAAANNYAGTPRNLVTDENGEDVHVQMTLDKGLYTMHCDAFQQAMALSTLKANQGFRGLVYMYVKVGDVMYKSQLKSITETTGDAPTDEASAIAALDSEDEVYGNNVIFYVPTNGTNVQFGVENPQRLGNGIDEGSGSWVAFKNIKIEKFNAELAEASMTVNAGKYGTFLAPFDITMPADVTAYKATLVEGKTTVQLEEEAGPGETLEAKTPVVLFNGGDAAVTKRVYRGVNKAGDATTQKVGSLVGFYQSGITVPNDGKSYVLQTQKIEDESIQAFYKVNSTFTGTANRCYIVAPDGGASLVKAYAFTDEDAENIATALGLVQADEKQETKAVYDLSGRRVQNAQKGIYIINGKKVVIK